MTAFRMLAIEQLHESSINPRKSFNKERLAELTASVKAKGVLQPLVVRPNADGFEIVCGARRYRAAKAAELVEIPAIVRELTDGEVLEVAVIENLQRDDVHPLEEAEGYERLLKLPGYSADTIAEKVGKSRAYVYAQLKLCALSPKSREAFYAGGLTKSTALLVARIPTAKLQEQATKEITERDNRGDVLPYRQAMEHIHRNYMLRLKEAPFKTNDPKLVPKAGECGACPNRTGNQPELFADVGSADVCTDPACFSAKREAHFAGVRKAAEAKGQEVISGKAAKQIVAEWGGIGGGYTRADNTHWWAGNQAVDVPAMLKKLPDVPVKLVEMPSTHVLVQVVEERALESAMRKAGLIKTPASKSKSGSGTKRSTTSGPDKAEVEAQIRWRVIDAVRGRLTADPGTVSTADGALVASMLWEQIVEAGNDGAERIAIAYGWIDPPKPDDKKGKQAGYRDYQKLQRLSERFPTLSSQELWRVLIDLALAWYVDNDYSERPAEPKVLYDAAMRHGVDAAAIRTEIVAAEKAKLEEAKASAKEKAAKSKKKAAAK